MVLRALVMMPITVSAVRLKFVLLSFAVLGIKTSCDWSTGLTASIEFVLFESLPNISLDEPWPSMSSESSLNTTESNTDDATNWLGTLKSGDNERSSETFCIGILTFGSNGE
ncbi:hypothetical protein GCK72_024291 [Caenorhabditis remanei]|uniref:Uncharacterized protein n=1 Tax=Caenorhabditis remanei TaxID=31234 RepID=A0A6A5FZE7_CAERE|nr:hypothetical protein GCK72_024291 [Caenorhabditis remanei]KAF1747825.1 hypothetical protein GCK72_024291 [Caenorhabditis remanei]